MPAEASSAVVREKKKKKKARTSRNGSPVSICKTELEGYVQNFGRTHDKENSPVLCSPFVVGRCNRSGQKKPTENSE